MHLGRGLGLVAAAALVLTGCGGKTASAPGRELAYSLDRQLDPIHSGIYIADENGHQRLLLGSTPPEAQAVTWSPRGDRLLVEVETDSGELFKTMKANGSDVRQLGVAENAAWSPDGRLVALQDTDGRIKLVRPRGRHVETLRVHVSGEQITEGVSWSPDGAFVTTDFEPMKYVGDVLPSTIVKLRANGRGRSIFLHGPGKVDEDGGAVWSPDGQRIAFLHSEAEEVWVMRSDGTGRRRIATGTESFAWSADGRSVLCDLARQGRRGVYAFPMTGGPPRRLGPSGHGLLASGGRYRTSLGDRVSWAPGGRLLVRVDLNGRIVLSRPDGSHAHRLTDPFAPDGPRWSPDGTRIAYDKLYAASGTGVYVASAASGRARRVGNGALYQWSPDGRSVLVSAGTGFELIDIASGRVTFGPVRGGGAVLSPDAHTIAFVRDPHRDEYGNSYDSVLYLVDVAGGDPRPLAQVHPVGDGLAFGDPVWAPDGKSVFIEQDDPVGEVEGAIRRLPLDGSPGRVLASEELSTFRNLTVSPTGDRLAYTTESGIETLTVADGSRHKLPHTPGGELNELAWSPDGAELAFDDLTDETPNGGLYVIAFDGTGRKLVSARSQAVDFFDWRPSR